MEKLSMQEGISQISDSKTFSGIARVTSYLSKDLKVLNRVYKVDFSIPSVFQLRPTSSFLAASHELHYSFPSTILSTFL